MAIARSLAPAGALFPFIVLLVLCQISRATGAVISDAPDASRAVHAVLDDWHAAAAQADEERYFGHFSPGAVFLGTDATERWTVEEFRAYAAPHFRRGRAWTLTPVERHVVIDPSGTTAWFDESLDTPHMGPCRGSGVLRRIGEAWKIAHYSLTIPIPNGLVGELVPIIARHLSENEDEMTPTIRIGAWRAWLDCPGDELPFGLEFTRSATNGLEAFVTNGAERSPVPIVRELNGEVTLSIDYYDSSIHAKLSGDGDRLVGIWTKRRGKDRQAQLPFHAQRSEESRFLPDVGAPGNPAEIQGRWSVRFGSSDQPAIAKFEADAAGVVTGTFLTPTGDYRFLEGDYRAGLLRLSAFDGAHAFLFHARTQPDGSLKGDFWSGDWWHDPWTATRDDRSSLPDAFSMTTSREEARISTLAFPDDTGAIRSFGDADLQGNARIIVLIGTWCPNCRDATRFLSELNAEYRARGLRVIALAFELTGDFERDAAQVRLYRERFGIEYPVLIAGVSNKKAASEAFPVIDEVRAFPTTLFLDRRGRIRAVHTGFSGPATGTMYEEQAAAFRRLIKELLAEKD